MPDTRQHIHNRTALLGNHEVISDGTGALAGAATVIEAIGFNDSADTTFYWQLYQWDFTSGAQPAVGIRPLQNVKVPPGGNFCLTPKDGLQLGATPNAWGWFVSSNADHLVLAGAASFWVDVTWDPGT